ncbi:hypothetical protein FH972_001246 [Carpinus fangiana]|uniref:Uncharacterized protein n=1 Tax=Carpinus fangiana TaxID=176857 RepID=A0A5N6QDK7_9ROSI|nr:hypothetical protein FH972_001246 [Carpinus fangiana]
MPENQSTGYLIALPSACGLANLLKNSDDFFRRDVAGHRDLVELRFDVVRFNIW